MAELLIRDHPLPDGTSVRVLTLNRPERRNALSPALQEALLAALEAAEAAPGVRAMVLTGAGGAFCSGLDLGALQDLSARSTEENRRDSARFAKLLERLYTHPKPVVAAVNGPAVAGGAGLVNACDLAVMSQDARIGYTEARIGFVGALVGVFLVRQVGEKRAKDLLLSARLVGAEEAERMGLVNEVCAPEGVLSRALARAEALAANAPSSLAMTKLLLASAPSLGLAEGLRYAGELNALARTTDDLKEGVAAFLEKRPPRWAPPQRAAQD
jgi:methylglutaconyl-CoA hydratase